jgi:hypothetical protein
MKLELELEELDNFKDLEPKHSLSCGVSRETAEEMDYKIVQNWPPCSLDLNPIEQIWGLLKKNTSKRKPRSMEKLE